MKKLRKLLKKAKNGEVYDKILENASHAKKGINAGKKLPRRPGTIG